MTRSFFIALILPLVTAIPGFAQVFDASANDSLKGDYFTREILIAG